MTDPYTEVADYIASRVTLLDYGAWLVKLSLDDRETTELLTYDKDDGFVWDNDWYEGERDVKVIDFVDTSDVDPAMRWHSVKKDGTPTVPGRYFVTAVDEDGKRVLYANYAWCDWSWQFLDKEDDEWYYSDDDDVIAWMPYPDPYEGD